MSAESPRWARHGRHMPEGLQEEGFTHPTRWEDLGLLVGLSQLILRHFMVIATGCKLFMIIDIAIPFFTYFHM